MSTEFTVNYFPESFTPSENDIILGRQKVASKHPGNLWLDQLIGSYLEDYRMSLEDKNRKSEILADIYDKINHENGRFVKLDHKQRKWYEVTKSVARERISQGLRDNLKEYYKSSLAYKKKRRLVKNGILPQDDPGLQIANTFAGKSPASKRRRMGTEDGSTQARDTPTQPTIVAKAEGAPKDIPLKNKITSSSAGTTEKETSDGDEKNPSAPFLPRDGIKLMEEGFEPHQNDIIVGLRNRSAQHPGNKYLAEVVKTFLDEYKSAGSNKNLKSQVLNKVGSVLSSLNPPARFVRLEQQYQRWYEVEAFYSREKISQTFRDIAQDGYRSANTFKNLRRRRGSSAKMTNAREGEKEGIVETKEPGAIDHEGSTLEVQSMESNPSMTGHSNNKRLPPKKAAARKAAASGSAPATNNAAVAAAAASTATTGTANDSATTTAATTTIQSSIEFPSYIDVSILSKKEQLALQIEKLKKEMEMLEEEEGKLKDAAATNGRNNQTQQQQTSNVEEEKIGGDAKSEKPTSKNQASV